MRDKYVIIDYTNWRGERRKRIIEPIDIFFGKMEWHKEPQYLMDAFDEEDGRRKEFAMKDIHSWRPAV